MSFQSSPVVDFTHWFSRGPQRFSLFPARGTANILLLPIIHFAYTMLIFFLTAQGEKCAFAL